MTRKAVLAGFGLARGTARDARDRLIAAGHLERRADGGVRFTDPLLARWVAAGREALL